jgi:hypothetical protein
MTRPIIRIHDTAKDEVLDREMTVSEFEQYKVKHAEFVARQAETEAKAEVKAAAQAKLAALGLTVQELQALGL